MDKVKEIVITAAVTGVIAGAGYFVKDYVELKEKELIRKENILLSNSYKKLDSLHKVEIEERKKYKEYVKNLVDSVLKVSKTNSEMTKDAIILLEENEYAITNNERDSLYSVLNAYTIGAKSSIDK
jgi:hypothetical protein